MGSGSTHTRETILHYILYVQLHFSKKKLNLLIVGKLFDKKIKQGLARIQAFFKSPNDSVHTELYTFPPNLTAVLRGCVRE